jgi:hypothetical protein
MRSCIAVTERSRRPQRSAPSAQIKAKAAPAAAPRSSPVRNWPRPAPANRATKGKTYARRAARKGAPVGTSSATRAPGHAPSALSTAYWPHRVPAASINDAPRHPPGSSQRPHPPWGLAILTMACPSWTCSTVPSTCMNNPDQMIRPSVLGRHDPGINSERDSIRYRLRSSTPSAARCSARRGTSPMAVI